MANSKAYGTYTQKERLGFIKNGNEAVYNSEKANNAAYRKTLSELGLSTENVDMWDKTIDQAYESTSDSYKVSRVGPRFYNGYIGSVISGYRSKLKELQKALDDGISQAQLSAQTESDALDEWLSSNGYSSDGSLAKKQRSRIEEELSDKVSSLIDNFDKKRAEAKKKYKTNLSVAKSFSDRTKLK